jgi:hypothetical protein
MGAQDANHEHVGPEEVLRELRRAARTATTPPSVKVMCGRVLREIAKFEAWVEPIFDIDHAHAVALVEQACELEEYAAFTLRIMRRARLGEPCPEVDEDGSTLATDEDIIRGVVDALAACRRYFWVTRNQEAKRPPPAAPPVVPPIVPSA